MQPEPTQFRGYTSSAKIEVILRMTNERGDVDENKIEDVEGAICLLRINGGDVRTVMIGEPRSIYEICKRATFLIEKGIEEIMKRIKSV